MKIFRLVMVLCALAVPLGARSGERAFLTQEEIRARLDELYRRDDGSFASLCFWHVDRGYRINGPFKPYDYHCPICKTVTGYRDKILIGTTTDIEEYLTWARTTVAELRALRLDVCLDERVLCARCRSELRIPDGGEIVQIPEVWPAWRDKQDVFQFKSRLVI